MSERDESGYWTDKGGHLWKDDRGPESHCARPDCGLVYARWSGDDCPAAPAEAASESSALVEFLTARLDEAQTAALAADQGVWDDPYGEFRSRGGETFAHVLRHGPARVLREVEAKRRIVTLAREAEEASNTSVGDDYLMAAHWAEDALKALAAAYADHTDYREEWRP